MESSPLLALRSLVMLVSVVAIPLAAVVGTSSWPQVLEAVHRLREQLAEIVEPDEPTPQPLAAAPLTPLAPMVPARSEAAARVPSSQRAKISRAPAFWTEPTPTVTATMPPTAPANRPTTPSVDVAAKQFDRQLLPPSQPARLPAPIETAPVPQTARLGEVGLPQPDPLEAIQQRLQALGALHYRLETAGASGEWYRFQCKMGLADNPGYVRYFDAVDVEATRAMQRVLRDVEAWALKAPAAL